MLGENSIINNRYRLEKKIGQGGFARVYLGTDELLKRPVAIKVLSNDLSEDENFLGRFQKEAVSVASLNHPNILSVFDYGHVENTAYLVMPYISGGTLADKLRGGQKLHPQDASFFLRQAAAALDYAHRRSIVHRDVKPQNMLIESETNHLLLADFGIAKVLRSSNSSNSNTAVMGTLSYMAPEQLSGNVGLTTDVYALGCVLFQMLTGQLPYSGATETVITSHLMAPVPSLVARSQGTLPPILQTIFDRALAKKPEDRYASAGEMAKTFQAIISSISNTPAANYQTMPIPGGPNPITGRSATFENQVNPQQYPPTVAQNNYPIPGSSNFTPSNPTPSWYTPTNPPQPISTVTPPQGLQPTQIVTGSNTGSQSQTVIAPVRKKRNGGLLIGGGVALLAIALAIGAFILFFNKPDLNLGLKEANSSFFEKGEHEAGLAKFKSLTNSYPEEFRLWRDYGLAQYFWKRDVDSIDTLNKAVRLNPKDPQTSLYLTSALLDNYRFGEAEKAAKTTQELDPNGWYGHAAIAAYNSRIFKFDVAVPEFAAMQKAAGTTTDPYYYWVIGTYYYYEAKTKWPNFSATNRAGYEALDKIISNWPDMPQIVALRGIFFAGADVTNNIPRGAEIVQQAFKQQPDSSRILSILGYLARFYQNDLSNGDKYARDALKLNDGDPEANLVLAGVLGSRKDFDGAYKRYEKCTQVNPYQDQCYHDWAYFLGVQSLEEDLTGSKDKALTLRQQGLEKAQKALSFTPNHAEYALRVAYFQYFLGNYNEAIKLLEKNTTVRTNSAWDYAILGLSYLATGQKAGAQDMFNRALKVDANDYYVKNLGERLAKA